MKALKINLYEFGELDEAAKRTALDEQLDINLFDDWHEAVLSDFKKVCETLGIAVASGAIHFSGFYSRGDGSAFKAEANLAELLKAVTDPHRIKYAPDLEDSLPKPQVDGRVLDLITKGKLETEAIIYQPTSAYYVRAQLYAILPNPEKYDRIGEEFHKLWQWFDELAETLNKYLYDRLEANYDYLTSDEAIQEGIKANEYHFTKDGRNAHKLERLAEGEAA